MKSARVKINCAGTGDLITKIKSFPVPSSQDKPSPDFSLCAGEREGQPCLLSCSGPWWPCIHCQRGGAGRGAPPSPGSISPPPEVGAEGREVQADLAASPVGEACETPKLFPPSTASNGAQGLSLGPPVQGSRNACSTLLSATRLHSLSTGSAKPGSLKHLPSMLRRTTAGSHL